MAVSLPKRQNSSTLLFQRAPRDRPRQRVRSQERAKLKFINDDPRQVGKCLDEVRIGVVRARIHRTDRTDVVPVRRVERSAGIEPNEGLADHEQVVDEARIEVGVRDHERPSLPYRDVTKSGSTVDLGGAEPASRLEPLPVSIDQVDRRDRDTEQARDQPRDPVERLLGRRVEDVVSVERQWLMVLGSRTLRMATLLAGLLASPGAFALSEETPESMPDFAGRDETFGYCIGCYSMKVVGRQGMSRARWDETLTWMSEKHAMPAPDADTRKVLLDYLEQAYPAKPATGGGWTNPFQLQDLGG